MAADAKSPNPAQPGRGGAEIPIHPLVTKLLDESGEPQNLVTMVGYIGPSKKEAHVRLYTGLDFQTYYEVPRESVALAEAVDREDDNSPTRVMIEAGATVELVQTSRQTGPASYLAGAIAGTYLAGAAAAQAPAAIRWPTYLANCRPEHTLYATQCYCTQECAGITDFCGGPVSALCLPQVQGGGPAAAQAQPAWFIPLSVLCPSVGVPCPSRGLYCPTHLCPITQPPRAEEAAQAAMGPQIGGWSIGCPSIYLACGTHIHCGGTPRCPMVQPAAPQVMTNPFCPTATHCTMARPCTIHHGCPTAAVVC